jgi:predicted metal-dependent phosphoesterase TrpH
MSSEMSSELPPGRGGGVGGFDLHVHSKASDGTQSPEAVARSAREVGLEGFALTDHDTVRGLRAATVAAAREDLGFVTGIELSAEDRDREVHVLGYCLDPEDERLAGRLARVRALREERIAAIVERLRALGFPIRLEEVAAEAAGANPGRPHVAAVLLRRGLVGEDRQVWREYLGRRGAAFVPRPRPSVAQAIAWVREAGGVPVLAHPALGLSPMRLEELLELGVRGLEVDHPEQDPQARLRLRRLARERGLIATGGSDNHGSRGHHAALGSERVSREVVEALVRARPSCAGRPPRSGRPPGPRG